MMILDIHTHKKAPAPEAVVAVDWASEENGFEYLPGQLYSLGFHPWFIMSQKLLQPEEFRAAARSPQIAAIGESGIDILKGGFLFKQINTFKSIVEISEELRKPLIIHDVKAHDIIIGLKKDLRPLQKWAIHGFRGKPSVADMFLRQDCYLSFGESFNPETLKITPPDRILAETDNSSLPITGIISRLSEAFGKDLTAQIASNAASFLGIQQ